MAKTLSEALTRVRQIIKEPFYTLPANSGGTASCLQGSRSVIFPAGTLASNIKAGETFRFKPVVTIDDMDAPIDNWWGNVAPEPTIKMHGVASTKLTNYNWNSSMTKLGAYSFNFSNAHTLSLRVYIPDTDTITNLQYMQIGLGSGIGGATPSYCYYKVYPRNWVKEQWITLSILLASPDSSLYPDNFDISAINNISVRPITLYEWTGVWSNATNYILNDIVQYPDGMGLYYRALQANLNKNPSTEPTYWVEFTKTNRIYYFDYLTIGDYAELYYTIYEIVSTAVNTQEILLTRRYEGLWGGTDLAGQQLTSSYEITGGATPTAMLVDTISNAQKTLVQVLEELDENYFVTTQSITMAAELNTPTYPFRKILGFRNSAGKVFRPINIRERGNFATLWNFPSTEQDFYPYIYGNQIGVAPASSSAGVWLIDYLPVIADLKYDTDVFVLPDDYFEVLCYLAATAHTTDKIVHERASALITSMKQTAGGRQIAEPPHTIDLDPSYYT